MNSYRLIEMVQLNHVLVTILCAAGIVVLFFLYCLAVAKTNRLRLRIDNLLKNSSGDSIEELVAEYTETIERLDSDGGTLKKRMDRLDAIQRDCVQKTGLIRYNAFQDTGCDLSFSLALMDREGNGVVLSSIYGRNESIIYAKPLEKGESRHPLSKEEKEALNIASQQGVS